MKKYLFIFAVACVGLAFTSCKSTKDSAYKKAYEKAKAASEEQAAVPEVATVTPVVEQPAVQPAPANTYENVAVSSEDVTLISGSGLKNYSVVVGSFSLKANAEGLQNKLRAAGYDAQIAYNAARNMYRVVATTFADKASAAKSRDQLQSAYTGAWLLYQK